MFGRFVHVDVPACYACASRLRWRRRMRFVVELVFMIAAVAGAVWLLGGLPSGPFRKWIVMGVTLVLLVPFLIWQATHPPVVDITAYSDRIEYEFVDREYASAFAELNGATIDDEADET